MDTTIVGENIVVSLLAGIVHDVGHAAGLCAVRYITLVGDLVTAIKRRLYVSNLYSTRSGVATNSSTRDPGFTYFPTDTTVGDKLRLFKTKTTSQPSHIILLEARGTGRY